MTNGFSLLKIKKTKTYKKANSVLNRFTKGSITVFSNKIPKAVILGIVGTLLMYLSVAGIVSYSSPWWARGDTRYHVDYAWQVWNGDIPVRAEGVLYQPFIEIGGEKPQIIAANPPLYYILQAPVIGPLMNAGRWEAAIAVGRAINLLYGMMAILVLSWAGWVFGGRKYREILAVAVPLISVMTYRFTRLNLDYAIDAFLVVLTTLSMIFMYKMLVKGVSWKYGLILSALAVAGMSTKAPFIILLGAILLSFPVSLLLHSKKKEKVKQTAKGVLISIGILSLVLLAIGWFYYNWNYVVHGKWFTARPPDYTGGRISKSVTDVLFGKDFWELFYGDFSRNIAVSVSLASFAVAGYLTMTKDEVQKMISNKRFLSGLGLLLLVFGGIVATQFEHAVGIGAINFRYLLPAILPIGIFLAFGLLQIKSMRGQLVTIFAVLMGWSSIAAKEGILSVAADNGLSKAVPLGFLAIFIPGAIFIAISMHKLSKKVT